MFLEVDQDHHEVHVDAYQAIGGSLGAIKMVITELERVRDRLEQFETLT